MEYTPAAFLKTNFQDKRKSECENNCLFLFTLHQENKNKKKYCLAFAVRIYLWISNKTLSKRMDYLQDIAVQKVNM